MMERYPLIQKTIVILTLLVSAGCYHSIAADEITAREFGRQDQAEKVRYLAEADDTFNEGIILYQNGEYEHARLKFSLLVGAMPMHQRITAAYVMYSKVLQKLGRYNESTAYANELIDSYSQSNYVDDAYFVKAVNYYFEEKYYLSAQDFMWVIDNGKNKKLITDSVRLLEGLADAFLSLDELRTLERDAQKKSKALLTLKCVAAEIREGLKARALVRLERFIDEYPKSRELPRVQTLLAQAKSDVPSKIRVGIILPLTGFYAEEGNAVLRGIEYGLRKNDSELTDSIELIVYDSESDILKAVQQAQRLVQDPSILFVIGELESVNSVGIGAVVAPSSVPLIIPVSSDNYLTHLGNRVFQMNPDLNRLGSELAKYAIEELELRTFATLAPRDRYGTMMTDSFVETVDALGGTIVAQKWYFEGTIDVERQMKSMREVGLRRELAGTLERVLGRATPTQLDSAWNAENEAFMEETEDDKTLVQANDIPVTSIDAIFLPIYTEEIPIIVPQFKLENIQAQMLGGTFWYDEEQLRKNREDVNRVVFVTDHFLSEYIPEFRQFRDDFRIAMGTSPDVMTFYGYDAISLAIEVMDQGGTYRDKFVELLSSISDFIGMKGTITFQDKKRVNSDVHVLRYYDGLVQRAEDVILPEEADDELQNEDMDQQ